MQSSAEVPPITIAQVIGRARRGAQRQHLLLQERQQAILGQHRRRRLEQKALVGGAAALGHEHELVGVIALGVDLALRRHVVGGVLFLIHRQAALPANSAGCGADRRRAHLPSSAASSSPSVMTLQPFLPMMIAVPVSWHIGSTPPAAMLAFFRKSKATNLSLSLASLSSRI